MRRYLPIAFISGIFLWSALVPPEWLQGLPLCYFKSVTALDCPGCGLTRAFSFLFHGHLRAAVGMNALAPVLVLWLSIYAAKDLLTLRRGKKPVWFTTEGSRMISRLFLFLFLGQWVFKTVTVFVG